MSSNYSSSQKPSVGAYFLLCKYDIELLALKDFHNSE